MLILYSLMEKNYSLGIFQLRKSIDFIAKVSEIIFSNQRVKYDRTSLLEGGWWEGGDFFQEAGGCNFHIKNKLKSEIFNDKKSL